MPTPTEPHILPKILVISGDPWYREDVNVILEKSGIVSELPDFGPVINNTFALQAIEQHKDALWIIVDIILFFRPNLEELIRTLNPDIRKKVICFIPPSEYIRKIKKQWSVDEDLTDITSLKESVKKLGAVHCASNEDHYVACIRGTCPCSQ